ncbi:snake venom metalloproteinase HT-2-like isoform X2 [Littorina saxatilis]|uniref:snake venom metalloproteinase HT-2-like isoform X2 n=1 Tax=Littorina saxatilis TaxID=31220 RepID=UPI0038B437F2
MPSMAEERDSNKKRPRDERTQNEDTVHLELFTTQLAQNNTELQTNPNNTRLQRHSDFSERNPRREGLSTRCFADQGYITRTSHMLLFLGVVCVLAATAVVPISGQTVGAANLPEYFVDVLVVTDAPVYDAWFGRAQATRGVTQRQAALNALRVYLTLVVQEVDKRYRTLEKYNNFRLTVRPVGFYIAETAEQSPWTVAARAGAQGQVDAAASLRNLARWVRTTQGIPEHDHTMLLTGYDLVTDDSGVLFRYTIGRATVGTVCQGGGRSVSVLEDRGAFQSVHTGAHELGHSLGAVHDGQGNTCTAADRYIMAGGTEPRTPQNLRNPWFFSPVFRQ